MIKTLLISLLLSSSAASGADIYKHTDDDGSVHYSSQASESAELMVLQGLKKSPAPVSEPKDDAGPVVVYEEFIIDLPAANTLVKNDQANVRVSLTLNPALASGHKVQVRIDGQSLPEALAATHFTLQNVQEGSHSLQVSIVDEAGVELISAGPVQFSSQRFSAAPEDDTAR